MNQYAQMIRQLKTPDVMKRINQLYGQRDGMLVSQTTRCTCLLKRHEELIGADGPLTLVSAPGRTEIVGNHTDHNRGKVLAAAVNLDALAVVNKRADDRVRVFSEGYPALEISLSDLAIRDDEKGSTAALVRGMAAMMKERGFVVGGFDAVVNSTVRGGSGLSSSASFEVLTCAILDVLYNGWTVDPKLRAQLSQKVENDYFGKPSGLMDQMASSVGGLTFIDFKNDDPKIQSMNYDFAAKGVALAVVNTGGSHDDLTADYASIPAEMRLVAHCFGEQELRRVRPEQFRQSIGFIREKLGGVQADRAILRAAHYFDENQRVTDMVDALGRDDLDSFYAGVIESGRSSFMYLQNVSRPGHQELALALMMAENRLRGKGAWRVHGGGFAGTTLNFVPNKELDSFVKTMEAVFGAHCCNILDIRPEGAAYIPLGR